MSANATMAAQAAGFPASIGLSIPITGYLTLDIFCITLLGSLFVTLVNKYLTDQVKIKALRKEQKQLQKKMRKMMETDPKKAQAMQKELFAKNLEAMKQMMRPKILIVQMLPMLLLLLLVKAVYSQFGEFFNVFGLTTFGWLGTYITFSLINSLVLKKVLDVA
jgi:uncharacterized membrane protein (DUF106 family)